MIDEDKDWLILEQIADQSKQHVLSDVVSRRGFDRKISEYGSYNINYFILDAGLGFQLFTVCLYYSTLMKIYSY